MTDADKVELLRGAIARADRILDWILEDQTAQPESNLTMANRVRKILRSAMRKTEPQQDANTAKTSLPNVKIDVKAMMASGALTEGKKL